MPPVDSVGRHHCQTPSAEQAPLAASLIQIGPCNPGYTWKRALGEVMRPVHTTLASK